MLYHVDINYTASCIYPDSVYVISLPKPIINIPDSSTCAGASVLMHAYPTNVPNLNSYSPVTFSWTLNTNPIAGATDSLYTASSPVNYSAAVIQNYTVTLTVGECISTDNATITFNQKPTIVLADQIVACNEIDLLHIGAVGPAGSSYLWHTNLSYPISDPTNDTLTLVPDPTAKNVYPEGYYYVNVTNTFNCSATDSVKIIIHCKPTFYIPTGFRPDDPTHPVDNNFPVFGRHFTNYRMQIFNRWGEIIFESTDRNVMWDGTYRGEPMPAGVYPVYVTYEGDSEEYRGPYSYKGEITLIR